MTYVLRFRPEVVGDLEDAAQWYNDRRQGLGGEFLDNRTAAVALPPSPTQGRQRNSLSFAAPSW